MPVRKTLPQASPSLVNAAQEMAEEWRRLSARQIRRVPKDVREAVEAMIGLVGESPNGEAAAERTRVNGVSVSLANVDSPSTRFTGLVDWTAVAPGKRLQLVGICGCVTSPIESLVPLTRQRYFLRTKNSAYILSLERTASQRY